MSVIEPSPFLRRPVQLRPSPRTRKDYDREQAKVTLERLRYRNEVRKGLMNKFMQSLGDAGRRWFPSLCSLRFTNWFNS